MLHGNRSVKRVFCLLSSLLMLSGYFVTPIIATSRIEQRKSAKLALQNRRKELEKELNSTMSNFNEEEGKKKNLDSQIEVLQNLIDESTQYIEELENEISALEEEIRQINEDMDRKVVLLKNSLASIYVAGDTTTLDIILGAKSFEDFLDKADIVRSVSQTIQKLIDDLKSDLRDRESKKQEVEKAKADKESEKEDLEKNRIDLQRLVDESQAILDKLGDTAQACRREIDENDAEIKAIDDEIAKEQRRVEEERKRRAEAAAQQKAAQGSKQKDTAAPAVASGGYTWPAPGYSHITSGFNDCENRSHVHGAIDIGGDGKRGSIYGASIVAANSGTVIMARTCGGYGNCVVVDHGNGVTTLYGHLSSISVSKGQNVSRGQVIGKAGSTGFSTGPHLHFEYRINGKRTNPLNIVSPNC